ncbi:AMP-binding protein [Sporichthya brevicatena]|uniref:AMP-binding protein n=1 Tax=Sporichthya brevicatena TaxID=171442 RepID=UPI0031CE099F
MADTLTWQLVAAAAADRPRATAICDGETRLDYAEYWARSLRLVGSMQALGLGPGQSVVYQVPNWWESLVVHQAVAAAGGVSVPVPTTFARRELLTVLEQVRPVMIIVADHFRGVDLRTQMQDVAVELGLEVPLVVVRPAAPGSESDLAALLGPDVECGCPVPRAPDDICAVIYTSGSTSVPKGVLHTHEALVHEVRSRVAPFSLNRDDSVFMPSSLAHIAGLSYGVHLPALLGIPVVLQEVWDPPAAAELIERHGCTVMNGVTVMLAGLVDAYERRQSDSTLRVFACGGAPIGTELVRRATERLGAHVTRAYGCSEFPTLTWSTPGTDLHRVTSTEGRLVDHTCARVVDSTGSPVETGAVGELEAFGPERCVGYLDATLNAELFTDDGWVRTGDLASLDADNYLTIRGRKKDIIVRAGENISAAEIEAILRERDEVLDVAVLAVPDPVVGERACAVLQVPPGAEVTVATVARWMAESGLSKRKWPEVVHCLHDLPRTSSGKVAKTALLDVVLQGQEI